jgi:hypothetical protein
VTQCGRPTKKGTTCTIARMAAWEWVADRRYEALACHVHATPRERAEFAAIAAEFATSVDRHIAAVHQSMPVDCWSWPVSGDDRRRAAEAQACEDPRVARDLAWGLLADWQGGRCAICSRRSEFLDHSHKTGLVRGWLCRSCNIGEGFTDIPGGHFERYRMKNPASILGIEIRYYSPFTGWAEPESGERTDLDRSPGYKLAEYLADGQDEG